MAYFDPDRAVFAALAATLAAPPETTRFEYVNRSAVAQFGDDLRGRRVIELFATILGDDVLGNKAFARLLKDGSLTIEGQLNGRDVQGHAMVDPAERHLQTAIVDITESRRAQEGFEYTVYALARASEVNDQDTGQHNLRIARYAAELARLAGEPATFVDALALLAQLHDIGKIHIAPSLLRKPGRLTEAEYETVKLHTVYGARIIGDHPRLRVARDITLSHHERWDGSGYPQQRQGEAIPLAARIVAIVDVFDALVTARSYKSAFSYADAARIMREGDDRLEPHRHFDPALLTLFLDHYDHFTDIHRVLQDAPTVLG
ncbi:MAG: HD-GYP domain-containing protein [Trueperaceae bacterium]|nr:HD-GYP domain-containing protein [Trueperaceae bacterium]